MSGAGDLDRRVTLERRTLVDDGYQEVETWAPVAVLWSSYTAVSDGERWAAGSVQADITARFKIRFRADVTTKDRVRYEGKVFNIVAVKEIGRRVFTEITGGLVNE
ncbi:phage head closure protein [Paracoccus sulfuroxidans]|uniref:SPP1 family predicted phage head-tail adaptor n=1 Tax=Paracoccus sulfuroxidans TaxID=384678 RepID=A0A562P1L3_9RHOB|nr:phage head closure protein [Paracoccus sulfuroxidans]TWI38231.1 SPP1 family predicted phage head-tail adaptor [Paracoccus sulfuroxidans]